MRLFLSDFLSVLKPEDAPRAGGLPVPEKAVLTGCLPVSGEDVFPGVDHADTVLSGNAGLSASIGFTEAEVERLLHCCGLDGRIKDEKARYDGYRFGSVKVYCPWDVRLPKLPSPAMLPAWRKCSSRFCAPMFPFVMRRRELRRKIIITASFPRFLPVQEAAFRISAPMRSPATGMRHYLLFRQRPGSLRRRH